MSTGVPHPQPFTRRAADASSEVAQEHQNAILNGHVIEKELEFWLEKEMDFRRHLVTEHSARLMSQFKQHTEFVLHLLETPRPDASTKPCAEVRSRFLEILDEAKNNGRKAYSNGGVYSQGNSTSSFAAKKIEAPRSDPPALVLEGITVDDIHPVLNSVDEGVHSEALLDEEVVQDSSAIERNPARRPSMTSHMTLQEGQSKRNSAFHLWSSDKVDPQAEDETAHVEEPPSPRSQSLAQRMAATIKAIEVYVLSLYTKQVENDETDLDLDEGPKESCLQWIVHSNYFTMGTMTLILANAVIIGWQTELDMQTIRHTEQGVHFTLGTEFKQVGVIFNLIFAVELILRILVDRMAFIFTPDFKWNLMDTVLVVFGLIEVFLENATNLSFARVLRILRMTRILRVIRVVRFFDNLRKMVSALLNSILSLFWLVLLLALVLFIFAVGFMQGIQQHIADNPSPKQSRNYDFFMEFYASLPKTMVSLLETISGSTGWFIVMGPVMEISWIYGIATIFFISFTLFGVMNVVTGIFVDRALYISQIDRNIVIRDEMAKTQEYVHELKHAFSKIDFDKDGTLTREEAKQSLARPEVAALLSFLELNISEAGQLQQLCDLLDPNGTDEIGIDDFVQACLRLKGAASSMDLCALLLEVSSMRNFLEDQTTDVHSRFDQVVATLEDLEKYVAPRAGEEGHMPKHHELQRKASEASFAAAKKRFRSHKLPSMIQTDALMKPVARR